MEMPLLSIIIATKNRVQYCIAVIETTLSLPDKDIELVVQDNTDSRELECYINQRPFDKRLKYQYTPPPFSFIDNFNAAVALAQGEYLCLIGDDDAVLPEIITTVRWAKRNGIDSICPRHNNYLWPGVHQEYPDGCLTIPKFSGEKYQINIDKQLMCLLKNGLMSYLKLNLPKIYHGIICKKNMEKIKERTGHYFGGLSPDIYSSIALSFFVEKHIVLDYPLTIAGSCIKSATADNRVGKHSGTYKNIPHLRDRGDYTWDEIIPRIYSVETIWAETGVKALKEMGKEELVKHFDSYRLFVYLYHNNHKYIKKLINEEFKLYKKNNNVPMILFLFNLCLAYLSIGIITVLKRLQQRRGGKIITSHVGNIKEAIEIYTKRKEYRNICPWTNQI
jgi:glycosyltransferase involved in cell wall biosynthesis